MIWLVEFAVLIIGLSLLIPLINKSGKQKNDERMQKRVTAYMETIRRTASPRALNAMNETELTDVLSAATQRVLHHKNNRILITTIAILVTVITAIFFASNGGIQSFVITVAIGALASYGIDRVLTRQLIEWADRQELDIDRLSID